MSIDDETEKAETEKFTFNLLTEPWIPLEDGKSGEIREVSIREALLQANQWKDLRCDKPITTVAILRLLLAILYRACPARNPAEWEAVWKSGQFPTGKITAYLNKWQHKFDLFSLDNPFLQVAGLQSSSLGVHKLATEFGTEFNKLLFEWETLDRIRECSPAQAARLLLEIQNFGLGGGISGKVQGLKIPEKRPNFEDGAVARGISIWLTDENFFKTLWLNTLPTGKPDSEDIPPWEQQDLLDLLEEQASGPIDRLIWQSRLVRLEPLSSSKGQVVVTAMHFTQGRRADKDVSTIPDLMSVYYSSKDKGIIALRITTDKASWRDLHTMIAFEKWQNQVLRWAGRAVEADIIPKDSRYRLNVVGMITNQASVSLWRHDRMSIPAVLLTQPELVGEMATAVNDAEFVAKEIRRRLSEVVRVYLQPNGKADRKDVDRFADALDTRPTFWARLEGHFTHFLIELGKDQDKAMSEWRSAVEAVAERSLRESCAKLGHSTRAIRAVAQGTAVTTFRFTANEAKEKARRAENDAKKKADEKAKKKLQAELAKNLNASPKTATAKSGQGDLSL